MCMVWCIGLGVSFIRVQLDVDHVSGIRFIHLFIHLSRTPSIDGDREEVAYVKVALESGVQSTCRSFKNGEAEI